MDCPRCGAVLDVVTVLGDLEVERCGACEGVLLDAGELRELVEDIRNERRGDLISTEPPALRSEHHKPTYGNCPKCAGALREYVMSFHFVDKHVVLDECPGCKALWVDGPEIPLLYRLVEEEDQHLDREYGRGVAAAAPGVSRRAFLSRLFSGGID